MPCREKRSETTVSIDYKSTFKREYEQFKVRHDDGRFDSTYDKLPSQTCYHATFNTMFKDRRTCFVVGKSALGKKAKKQALAVQEAAVPERPTKAPRLVFDVGFPWDPPPPIGIRGQDSGTLWNCVHLAINFQLICIMQ